MLTIDEWTVKGKKATDGENEIIYHEGSECRFEIEATDEMFDVPASVFIALITNENEAA